IKICGITTPNDAVAACEAGADVIGVVLSASPRQLSLAQAWEIVSELPPMHGAVGVFVDPSEATLNEALAELSLAAVQLRGAETPEFCRRIRKAPVVKRHAVAPGESSGSLAERIRPYDVAAHLLDPGAGSGRTFDWKIACGLPGRLIVTGGLTPEN